MNFYRLFRSIIFKIDAENAHNLAINFLKFLPKTASLFCTKKEYKSLKNSILGLNFENPIGLSAGFDKNAEIILSLQNFGFGFIECGTITPKAQIGNEKPRIFRLKKDKAIINCLGFNNFGADFFAKNISRTLPKLTTNLGINIGKNRETKNALDDYLPLLEKFYLDANYITINISSPNTKNLRDLQNEDNLSDFLEKIMSGKKQLIEKNNGKNTPIFLKIAPDLSEKEQENIVKIVLKNQIDGVIISNTTIDRNLDLSSKNIIQSGGLSGKPLFEKSNQVLKNFYQLTNGKVVLIGVGGVFNALDAYEKIKLGASLVQIYTGFIYEGFGLVEKIKKDLDLLLKKDGFDNISQAIGINTKSHL